MISESKNSCTAAGVCDHFSSEKGVCAGLVSCAIILFNHFRIWVSFDERQKLIRIQLRGIWLTPLNAYLLYNHLTFRASFLGRGGERLPNKL